MLLIVLAFEMSGDNCSSKKIDLSNEMTWKRFENGGIYED